MRLMACVAGLAVAIAPSLGGVAGAAPGCFVGDYSTGDFSQWHFVQNQGYYGPGEDYTQSYSAAIVEDQTHGYAARFELRSGDVLIPPNGNGERSEVMAGDEALGVDGDVVWYQFSTMFDSAFPQNHADLGWGVTNQFWGASGAAPPVAWSVGERNGYWSLVVQPQSEPAAYLGKLVIFETPLQLGVWHDVTMQVYWSTAADGWIKLWLNGKRQNFANGADVFHTRTLIPGTRSVRYKEGYYRHQTDASPTAVVFHSGFRCGAGDPAL